jgi:putative lipoprotein
LAFDANRIESNHRYAVDGRLLLTSTQTNLVITGGVLCEANIWVQRVASRKVDDEATSLTLAGEWLVEDIGGRGVIDNLQSTLHFDANGLVSGMGGCNSFRGSYSSSGNRLRFGPLAATRKACMSAIMDQEAKFFAALSRVRSARIEGPFLILESANGVQLAKLTRL